MILGLQELGKREGLFVAPEGAALWIAARKLLASSGYILPEEQVLLLNTGSGQKYMDNIEKNMS